MPATNPHQSHNIFQGLVTTAPEQERLASEFMPYFQMRVGEFAAAAVEAELPIQRIPLDSQHNDDGCTESITTTYARLWEVMHGTILTGEPRPLHIERRRRSYHNPHKYFTELPKEHEVRPTDTLYVHGTSIGITPAGKSLVLDSTAEFGPNTGRTYRGPASFRALRRISLSENPITARSLYSTASQPSLDDLRAALDNQLTEAFEDLGRQRADEIDNGRFERQPGYYNDTSTGTYTLSSRPPKRSILGRVFGAR